MAWHTEAVSMLTVWTSIAIFRRLTVLMIDNPEPQLFLNRRHVWSNNSSINTLLTVSSVFISHWPVLTTTVPVKIWLFECSYIVVYL